MTDQCRVTFKKDHHETQVEFTDEASVLELAIKNEVELAHSCGGNGTCGTCRVFVEKCVEKLPPKQGVELEMSEDRNFRKNERLSCQIQPQDGLVLIIPKAL
jgi:ferredoxin, 2Fe-2S